MDDDKKSKAELVADLAALRQQVRERDEASERLFERRLHSMAKVREVIGRMQGSGDVAQVLVAVREELRRLDVPFDSCGVSLLDETSASANVGYHSMTQSGEWVPPAADHPGAEIIKRIWREGKVAYRRDLAVEDTYGERPQIGLDFGDEIRCVVDVPFSQGTLAVNSKKPAAFSPTHIAILQGMAQVLTEGFRRTEDLRGLERVESSLHREYALRDAQNAVRVAIASMDEPEHLCRVVVEIGDQLRRVGIAHDSCSIQIVNEQGTDFISITKYIREEWADNILTFIATGEQPGDPSNMEYYPWVVEVWKSGEPRSVGLTELRGHSDSLPDISLVDVAFSQGTLAINKKGPDAFAAEDIAVLQRFAHVVSEGFQRFLHIIEQETAADELLKERNLLRTIIDNVPADVYVKDVESRFVMANANAMRSLRVESPEEFVGKTDFDFMPQDPAMAQECFDDEQEVIRTGRPLINKEQSGTDPDGAYLTGVTNKVPLLGIDGAIVGILGVSWDISERKRMEEELRKVQNLESLGLLAGGIAHDFNNLLTGVLANLGLLRMRLQRDSDEQAIALDAEKAAERARDLTQQLTTFASGGAPIKKIAAIDDLIREAAQLSLPGSKTKAVFDFAADLWPSNVDGGQISQVVQNLVINADQAMPNGGIVRIAAANANISADSPLSLKPGPYVLVTVQDQGTGMSDEIMRQIFDPYFTTKQAGHGLGLAICYSIISRHQGHLGVESAIDVGTTFRFYLPAAEERIKATEPLDAPPARGTGRILLMDDEEVVRNTVGRVLEELGYEVGLTVDGKQALRVYAEASEQGAPYDLVIMDLTIPGGMGGREAIVALLAADPEARALVTSGYADDPIMANYADYGFCGRLAKPIRLQELAEAVRASLT